jgi:alpha-L-rhamnosidase
MVAREVIIMIRLLLSIVLLSAALFASIRPVELKCEYRTNPLGIDVVRPRLSWMSAAVDPQAKGLRQTAYRVIVSSTASGDGDLWDSGKVVSNQSTHIEYAGKALASGRPAYWKVMLWDQAGQPSAWSEPAHWSMGLLLPGDWHASWIGRPEEGLPKSPESPFWPLTKANWIWQGEDPPQAGLRYFRTTFNLDRLPREASLVMGADSWFEVALNGRKVGVGMFVMMPQVFDARPYLKTGDNIITVQARSDSAGKPAGLIGSLKLDSAVVLTGRNWQASDKSDGSWAPARELGVYGIQPWGEVGFKEERRLPARYLRKDFELRKPVRRATAYISGLGLYELSVNGKRIGDSVLAPNLTDYDKRVFYNAYDVTPALASGRNFLDVTLGNGRWWAPRDTVPTFMRTYGAPQVILQLDIEYEDGTTSRVASDGSWLITTGGPIRANNEYDGEDYDARREDAARTWQAVRPMIPPPGTLVAQMSEPLRVTETLKPVKLSQPKPGVWVYDLGQNMVGWCRLKVAGLAGAKVTLRHAETVRPDGMLFLDNLRTALATDTYTLKGQGPEIWEPRFTYHGFRFVEVTGYPGEPTLEAIEGRVVHDAMTPTASFESSSNLLNRLHRNILWGVRGNYRSIPTDCPQRDERQGWLGDRSVVSRGETYLFDVAAFYSKWLQDLADAQRVDGSIPDVVPNYWPMYNDDVTWPSTFVLLPGVLYDQYGDRRIVERHYPAMKKWIDHMSRYITDGLMPRDTYGDWCVPPEKPELIHSEDPARKTAGPLIATAYFVEMLSQMDRYARILSKTDEAAQYRALAATMSAAYQRAYYDSAKGLYGNGTQTSSILTLAFSLTPADQRKALFDKLLGRIQSESNGHVGTGLIGAQWLMRTLTDNGGPDVAYRMVTKTDYPGWGYMVEKGATTVWELWNGDTADPAMNSGNHVMQIGDLAVWMYERLGGIRPDPEKPGFQHIIIRPIPSGDLSFVKVSHRSLYGVISSQWKRDGGRLELQVTIPPNTTATVHVPGRSGDSTQEVGSGTHTFVGQQ